MMDATLQVCHNITHNRELLKMATYIHNQAASN